jgi:hypothetical protein
MERIYQGFGDMMILTKSADGLPEIFCNPFFELIF